MQLLDARLHRILEVRQTHRTVTGPQAQDVGHRTGEETEGLSGRDIEARSFGSGVVSADEKGELCR